MKWKDLCNIDVETHTGQATSATKRIETSTHEGETEWEFQGMEQQCSDAAFSAQEHMDNLWSTCWKWETLETSALEQEEEPAVAGPVAAMGPDWTSTHQRTIHRMAIVYRRRVYEQT